MSPQKINADPLTCPGCKLEYGRAVMHDVEGPGTQWVEDEDGRLHAMPEILYICGPCYDAWIYGENMEYAPL